MSSMRSGAEKKMSIEMKKDIDWSGVMESCDQYAKEHEANGGEVDEDLEHYIFEGAMKAVFGEDVFQRLSV